MIDGLTGPNCDIVIERTCANQCSARGECQSGFCKCADGWYGHDCGQRRADTPYTPGKSSWYTPVPVVQNTANALMGVVNTTAGSGALTHPTRQVSVSKSVLSP